MNKRRHNPNVGMQMGTGENMYRGVARDVQLPSTFPQKMLLKGKANVHFIPSTRWLLLVLTFLLSATGTHSSTFSCNETTQECLCNADSCSQNCTTNEPCSGYLFECQEVPCEVFCVGPSSCDQTEFIMEAHTSTIRCMGDGACHNVECLPLH